MTSLANENYHRFGLTNPMESRVHAASLNTYGAKNPQALVLSGDLTSSTEADLFQSNYPDRFLSMGMAEQNMMSFAGGLAREGYLPIVHTFAVFMYRRALDQIEMSIAYPNLPVIMAGFLPGITTPGGVSHQSINDIGVLRTIPNMHILETGDATDVESVLDIAESLKAPVYLRMIRGSIPRLFDAPMQFNRARTLSEGSRVLLLTSGIMTKEGLYASRALTEFGVNVTHMHISTLKPFTDPDVLDALKNHEHTFVAENHSIIGGLGSIVSELIATHGINTRLTQIGIQDTYLHGASQQYLQTELGLDAFGLTQKVLSTLAQSANFSDIPTVSAEEITHVLHTQVKDSGTDSETLQPVVVTTPDEAL